MRERAKKPTGEVDQMNSLIQQLTASGDLWNRPPFPFVPQSPAVAISPPDKHQRSQRTRIDDLTSFLKSGVITMVETHLYTDFVRLRRCDERLKLRGVTGPRFLN